MNDLLFAFLLTVFAGIATGVGGLVVLFTNISNKKFLSICLSFSAGVMLYIAFAEIFLESIEFLEYRYGDETGYLIVTIAFFVGIALMAIVDKFIPHVDDMLSHAGEKELKRTGVMSAVAIAIHNFPEGLITFMAALYDPAMGIAIALAIIIHNIPEGISVAAPIYYSTGSRAKALLASIGAGLTEPLGALAAWVLLRNIFGDIEGIFGITFAVVAGIMVFVAVHELLPTAHKYGKHHIVMKWLFIGMAVMAASLVSLEFIL